MADNSIISLPQPCMLWPGRCWKSCLLGACFKEEGGTGRGGGEEQTSCLFYLHSQQPGLLFLQVTSESLLLNSLLPVFEPFYGIANHGDLSQ